MSTRMMNRRELPPTKHARLASLALGSALALLACGDRDDGRTEGRAASALTTGDPVDLVVVEWNEIAVTTLGAIAPFPGTRAMAAVQVAVFEAVNAITGGYVPYFGTIIAPDGANAEAAAIVAAHDVLAWLVPTQVVSLDTLRNESLSAVTASQANKDDGIAVGHAAAAAVIAARTGDGSAPPQFYLPSDPTPDPYQWTTTAGCPPAGGAFFHWQNVKPYGVESSSQFRAPPPPALDSHRYADDFNEVQAVGYVGSPLRSEYHANVARIYAVQPPHAGWNSVARQILKTRQDSITDTARTLAMMNMSLSDAHITVFETKYFYTTWRPETAIPRGDEDGNSATIAGTFAPFIVTPCFPSYPSAHGAGAGAASRVLEKAYGRFHTIVNSVPDVLPGVELRYTDLKDIVTAVSDARVYGGIHFRFEQDAGEALGKKVANYNNDHRLAPLQPLAPE